MVTRHTLFYFFPLSPKPVIIKGSFWYYEVNFYRLYREKVEKLRTFSEAFFKKILF